MENHYSAIFTSINQEFLLANFADAYMRTGWLYTNKEAENTGDAAEIQNLR